MKHLCIKISEQNQSIAYCVEAQKQGIKGMFDNILYDCEYLEEFSEEGVTENFINNFIQGENGGPEGDVMRLINEEEINDRGFAEQDKQLWLTIGTYDDLIAEVKQEVEYQIRNRKEEEQY